VCSVTKARWVKYWSTTAGSKSAALRHWLRDQEFDFVLAVGDDHDDEELFTALPARGYSIRVGIGRTNAHFNLRESKDVIKLLEELRWAQSPPKAAVNHRG
jgi:trehalose-6-phosphatase